MPACIDILGGGPAGLAVAHYATRAGRPFRLFERSQALGGLCRTYTLGAHRYDSGAHRVHDRDPEITADLLGLLGDELVAVRAPSQVRYRDRFIDFPPRPLPWLRACGPVEGARAVAELLRQRNRRRPVRSFEDLVATRYGMRLGKPLLLDYSEKLWGLPGRDLAPEVATRRLTGLSLGGLLRDLMQARQPADHLDGSFLYPRGGYGVIVERLAATLDPTSLRLGAEVVGLDGKDGRIEAIRFADGNHVAVDGDIVSTLPLTLLVRMLGDTLPPDVPASAQALRFRHVRLVFLRLGMASVSPNASIYFPDPTMAISRVYEPKNRSLAMAPADETGLAVEVPCFGDDAVATCSPDALTARVVDDLARTGLIRPAHVLETRHHWLANAYPVYARDYRRHVEIIVDGLSRFSNLVLLGRGGRFWYSHLHDQMRAAKDYVRSLGASAASDATK